MSGRTILHVDMDAFFASVEQREAPETRGRPVIVGGRPGARGVVSAASYEARRFGVHSAMPLRRAGRLCPHGIFLPVRMELYARVSRQVFEICERYSPLVEPLSIDEAFLDLTGSERLLGRPLQAAREIKQSIRRELGLTASVGIAPNKFVAKIASDLQKPDGLVIVPPEEVEDFLAPLLIERMWGIGPRGAARLHARGIRTFADLARADLGGVFGAAGPGLRELARGRDARLVVREHAPKSIGHETTFREDVSDLDTLHHTLVALTDRVAARLRRLGLRARTVTLKVRYRPFHTITRRKTLQAPTCASAPLLAEVLRLFEQRTPQNHAAVRLLGVALSRFSAQATLFEGDGRVQARLDRAVDGIRRRFGAAALRRGSVPKSSDG